MSDRDESSPDVVFICRRNTRQRKCSNPECWNWHASIQCDYPIHDGKQTCDRWICPAHAYAVPGKKNTHWCLPHKRIHEAAERERAKDAVVAQPEPPAATAVIASDVAEATLRRGECPACGCSLLRDRTDIYLFIDKATSEPHVALRDVRSIEVTRVEDPAQCPLRKRLEDRKRYPGVQPPNPWPTPPNEGQL